MNKKILALAIPNLISNITIPLLGMVDMAIVGQLGVDSLIGAMAIGTTIFNFVYWNIAFLRMGASGLVAQAYGARDMREIAAVLVRTLFVALVLSFLLLIFQRWVGGAMFTMMHASAETMGYAADYFYARIWAAPATLSLFAFQGWFIGMQNSRFPMYISIVINILNVIFSVWFVFGFGLGIAGVAWGTVVAQYGGLLMAVGLWLLYYRRFLVHVDLRETLNLKPMVHFFRVNRDIFLRTACIVLVYTFFTSASSGMGDNMLAVNSLLMQLFTLYSYMMDGFAFAAESIIGKYVGARNPLMIQRYLKRMLLWSLGSALIYVVGYTLFWRDVLLIFTSSETIINEASKYILYVVVVPLVAFAPFLIDGALIGATQTRVMRNSVALATVAFFVVYYGLLNMVGNNALWIAFIVFLILRVVFQYFMTGRLTRFIS